MSQPRARWLTLVALSAAMTALAVAGAPALGANLLQNPGAEGSAGSPDGAAIINPPGWTVTAGTPTVIVYGASGGYPAVAVSQKLGGGANFFAGGNTTPSSMSQAVDVSAQAAAIDGGKLTATLSGLLGGFSSQDDNAQVTAFFLGAAGNELGRLGLPPVLATDRASNTDLLPRTQSVGVPAGTRSIRVDVVFTRLSGSANDGYLDNLSLDIAGAAATPAPPTPIVRGIPNPQVIRSGPSLVVAPKRISPARLKRTKCITVRVQTAAAGKVNVKVFSGPRSLRLFGSKLVPFAGPGSQVVCIAVPLRAHTFNLRSPLAVRVKLTYRP